MHKLQRLALSLATFALLLPALGAAAPGDGEKADKLFKQGREAIVAKKWSDAERLLSQAWELKQSYDIAANLGQSEIKLEQYRDAAEHLEYCLRHFPAKEDAEVRRRITQAFEQAKNEVGAIKLSVDRDGATITVDGKAAGTAPLDAPLFVEPGLRVIEATLAEVASAKQEINIVAGEDRELALELKDDSSLPGSGLGAPPAATSSGSPEPLPTQPTQPEPKRDILPGVLIGSGVAVVGLGIGIGFTIAAGNSKSDAESIDGSLPGDNSCGAGSPFTARCAELNDKWQAADNQRNISYIGFGVAGAAVVGTLVYVLWPQPQGTAGVRPNLAVGGGGARMSLSGAF